MHIIIWANKYAPESGVGGRRWRLFGRSLAQKGHAVTFVVPFEKTTESSRLEEEVDGNVSLIRVGSFRDLLTLFISRKSPFLNRFLTKVLWSLDRHLFHCIDQAEQWARYSQKKVAELVKKGDADVLIATGHPCSINYWAADLKRHFPHILLVQDLRDLWNQEVNYSEMALKGLKAKSLDYERFSVEKADLVINVSPLQLEIARASHPGMEGKFHVLTNGFDPAAYRGVVWSPPKRVHLVHAGSIRWKAKEGLRALLQAVVKLDPILEQHDFRIDFYGARPHVFSEGEFQIIVDKYFSFFEQVSQEKLSEALSEASAGLIIFDKDSGYSTKIFDYLGIGMPFLAICPAGELSELCQKWALPTCGYNATQIAEALHSLLNGKIPGDISEQDRNNFSVPELTESLIARLDCALKNRVPEVTYGNER